MTKTGSDVLLIISLGGRELSVLQMGLSKNPLSKKCTKMDHLEENH